MVALAAATVPVLYYCLYKMDCEDLIQILWELFYL